MNNVEINKKYIREQIKEEEQTQFYSFFSKQQDYIHFQEWTTERAIEVVKMFREQQKHRAELRIPQIVVEVKPKQEKTTENSHHSERTSTQLQKKNQEDKFYTSLNLLEEIETKKAINTDNNNRKPEKREQNWLNATDITSLLNSNPSPAKFDNSLFQSFDLIINKETPAKAQDSRPSSRMSLPVLSNKKEPEKSRKNQSEANKSNFKNQQEKAPTKNDLKDRLFKMKLYETIKCKKAQNQTKCKKISIQHHQMVHRIFLPDYAMYNMQVQPSKLVCKRTYDDFVCLRNTLHQIYPCVKIPYLQSGSWLSENDIVLINKNKYHLEMFMKGILEHPLLSKLDVVSKFISIVEHKQIKKYFEEENKLIPPQGINEFVSQTGQLSIILSSEQYELITQLPKWQHIFEDYFEKYHDLLSNLQAQLETVHICFSQLQKLSIQMQNTLKQLTQRSTEIQRQEDFQMFFKEQEKFYAKRSKESQDEILNLNEVLIPFIKYQRLNINQFKPFLESVSKLTQKYLKKIENQPESPCSVDDIATIIAKNKLKDDIWSENQSMPFFKLQLGYLHTTLLNQTHIYSNRLINNLMKVWQQLFGTNISSYICKDKLSIKSSQH